MHAASIKTIATRPRSQANLVEASTSIDELPSVICPALSHAGTDSIDVELKHTPWLNLPLSSIQGADEPSFTHATRDTAPTQTFCAPIPVFYHDVCPDILSSSLVSDAQVIMTPLATSPHKASPNPFAPASRGPSTSGPVHATVPEPECAVKSARQSPVPSKPFPCPRPNCTKSYKQYKGLKYHITHGTCSSKSSQDRIPVWQALLPKNGSPDEHGLSDNSPRGSERRAARAVRPYVCSVGDCTRRYKDVAGLKYHYFHSDLHGIDGLKLLASGRHECLPLLTKRVRQTTQNLAVEALEALQVVMGGGT